MKNQMMKNNHVIKLPLHFQNTWLLLLHKQIMYLQSKCISRAKICKYPNIESWLIFFATKAACTISCNSYFRKTKLCSFPRTPTYPYPPKTPCKCTSACLRVVHICTHALFKWCYLWLPNINKLSSSRRSKPAFFRYWNGIIHYGNMENINSEYPIIVSMD